MIIQKPTISQLSEMYDISTMVHANEYTDWVPAERLAEFRARYERSGGARARFIKIWCSRLNHSRWHIRVVCIDESLVGFIAMRRSDETHAVVRSLFVDGNVRKGGIGSALMHEALLPDTHYELKVAMPNTRAQRFYENFGFTATGQLAGDFFGIPLLKMERSID